MADRRVKNAYYPNLGARRSSQTARDKLFTIVSNDDDSSAQSEISSVVISDVSSVESSDYTESRDSYMPSVESSVCKSTLDCLSPSGDDTTDTLDDDSSVSHLPPGAYQSKSSSQSDGITTDTLDDDSKVSDFPTRSYGSKSTSLSSIGSTESSDSPWVDTSDSSSSDSFDTDTTGGSPMHGRPVHQSRVRQSHVHGRRRVPNKTPMKRTEMAAGNGTRRSTRSGNAAKPIDLTDLELGRTGMMGNNNKIPTVKNHRKLRGVDYVASLDVASTDKDLSVAQPIGKQYASDAFQRAVPNHIPVDSDRDDVSSIGAISSKVSRFHPRSFDNRRRSDIDPRPQLKVERVISPQREQVGKPAVRVVRAMEEQEERKDVWWRGGRSDLELFFVVLISISLIILIILLAIVLLK